MHVTVSHIRSPEKPKSMSERPQLFHRIGQGPFDTRFKIAKLVDTKLIDKLQALGRRDTTFQASSAAATGLVARLAF